MRLALVPIALDSRSRASNTQRLIAAIDAAADRDPAPDLLVLPGSCDSGGASFHRQWTEAYAETILALLAEKARQWRTHIAAGLHRRLHDSWHTYAALFDPDGDIVLRSAAGLSGASDAEPAIFHAAIGTMMVVDPASEVDVTVGSVERGEDRMLLLAPVPVLHRMEARERLEMNLSRLRSRELGRGTYCAVVSPVGVGRAEEEGRAGETYLRGPDGMVLASTNGEEAAPLICEIPERSARPAAGSELLDRPTKQDSSTRRRAK